MLYLLPAVAIAGAAAAAAGIGRAAPVPAALAATLSAVGAWAVTRELAPDDNPAAFVSLFLAFGAQLAWGPATVVPLFVTLVLARIVNRTTGMPPRPLETALIAGFVVWAMARLGDPLIGMAAALAFFLDASLSRPARWQILTGFACFSASIYVVLRDGMSMPLVVELDDVRFWLGVLTVTGFSLVLLGTRDVLAVGDVSRETLDPARVRGGMFVAGFITATAPLYVGDRGFNGLLWSCLAGVVLSQLLNRGALLLRKDKRS